MPQNFDEKGKFATCILLVSHMDNKKCGAAVATLSQNY